MRFRPDVDYYEILQVHPRASAEMVKKAYRTLMGEMRGHPDLGGDEERARLINEAYTVLADPDLRRAYDRARGAGRRPTVGGSAGSAGAAGPAIELDRLAEWGRKCVLSLVTVMVALALARVLRSPTLDLADLAAMVVLLMRIWSQTTLPRGA